MFAQVRVRVDVPVSRMPRQPLRRKSGPGQDVDTPRRSPRPAHPTLVRPGSRHAYPTRAQPDRRSRRSGADRLRRSRHRTPAEHLTTRHRPVDPPARQGAKRRPGHQTHERGQPLMRNLHFRRAARTSVLGGAALVAALALTACQGGATAAADNAMRLRAAEARHAAPRRPPPRTARRRTARARPPPVPVRTPPRSPVPPPGPRRRRSRRTVTPAAGPCRRAPARTPS